MVHLLALVRMNEGNPFLFDTRRTVPLHAVVGGDGGVETLGVVEGLTAVTLDVLLFLSQYKVCKQGV